MPTGYIYEIYNEMDPNQSFIGSTTTSLRKAKYKFIYEMKNRHRRSINPKLQAVGDIVPIDHWAIRELDRVEFEDRSKLRQFEAIYIRRNKPTLNQFYALHSCPYCGKQMKKKSLNAHLFKSCPVKKSAIFQESQLSKLDYFGTHGLEKVDLPRLEKGRKKNDYD